VQRQHRSATPESSPSPTAFADAESGADAESDAGRYAVNDSNTESDAVELAPQGANQFLP